MHFWQLFEKFSEASYNQFIITNHKYARIIATKYMDLGANNALGASLERSSAMESSAARTENMVCGAIPD